MRQIGGQRKLQCLTTIRISRLDGSRGGLVPGRSGRRDNLFPPLLLSWVRFPGKPFSGPVASPSYWELSPVRSGGKCERGAPGGQGAAPMRMAAGAASRVAHAGGFPARSGGYP